MHKEIWSANIVLTNTKNDVTIEKYPLTVNDGKYHFDDVTLSSVLRISKIGDKDKKSYKLKSVVLNKKIGL